MHERISAGQTSFIGADLSTLADCWRQLAPRRVSLLNSVLFDEPLAAVQSVLRSGDYRVETITHVFMSGQPLSHDEASWPAPRAQLDRKSTRLNSSHQYASR